MVSRHIIIYITLLFLSINIISQVPDIENADLSRVKIDEISDQQIKQIQQRAEQSGMTESQMKAALLTRGLPPSELNKLEKRLTGLSSEETSLDIVNRNRKDILIEEKEDIFMSLYNPDEVVLTEEEFNLTKRIFGYDLFRNDALTFEPSLNIPTPPDYQIGPGDQLIIDIWGASQQNYQLTVSPDGNIYIENLGPIQVSGKTLDQASEYVINRLKSIYAGLGGQNRNTYAQLTLGNTRTINVHILGEVNLPGTYTLSSLASLFNALYASGGPAINGSFRNIEVFRNDKLIAKLDVYDFLINGIQKNNIRLQDQDVIKVNPYKLRVDLTGEIKRPGIYELIGEESFSDLIEYSGGYTDKAYQKVLKIYRNTDTERKIIDIGKDNISSFSLHDGDSIPILPILNRFENRVTINGAVFRPGDYSIGQGLTLKALIDKSEGLREDAFLNRALIYRTREDFSLEIIPINLKDVFADNPKIIPLEKDDVVFISSIFDLREEYYMEIAGEINQKGVYPYMENTSLEDLIVIAGGLKESASLSKVEIARRVKSNEPEKQNSKISEIFYFDIDRELSLSEDALEFKLEPFDQVYVRRSPGYEEPQEFKIEGEVLYPGSYILDSKTDRISDLIARAGGLSNEAYPKGAQLIRRVELNKERQKAIENLMEESGDSLRFSIEESTEQAIGINLVKILENPHSKFDLLLQEGDRMVIPKEMQTVRLSGALLMPITVRYDKSYTFNKYISMAGGFASNAKRSKTYVIYANGSVDKTGNLLVINNYPKIEPGAEIVVPQKPEKQRMSTQEAIGLSSALTSMALIIVTIINTITPG